MHYAESELNLNMDFNDIKYRSVGNTMYDMYENKLSINAMISFDIFFSQKHLYDIADKINFLEALDPIDIETEAYERNLALWLGAKKSQKLKEEIKETGDYHRLPIEFEHTFMFTDVNLQWDSINNSYRSVGKLGLSNISNRRVDKYIPGYIELKKKGQSGDEITLYLEPYQGVWYIFHSLSNFMDVHSSDEDFNAEVAAIKERDRKKGKFQYQVQGGFREKFLERMEIK